MTTYVVLEHDQHEAGVNLLQGFRDKSAAINFVHQLLELKTSEFEESGEDCWLCKESCWIIRIKAVDIEL